MSEQVLKLLNPTFGKMHLILFLLEKQIKYIFVLTICIKKMPGVRRIAMKSIKTTLLASQRK